MNQRDSLRALGLVVSVGFASLLPGALWAATPPQVHAIAAPAGGFVPDVGPDSRGVLHMVYAQYQNAYHVRSSDNGASWTRPVRVNTEGRVEFKMGERGPKLAVGREGVLHVVWMDLWAPGVKTFARYTRSRDGGRTFETPRSVSSTTGIDGVTVTADAAGHVFVFWHVNDPPQKEIPAATWLHLARSDDNGAHFQPDERVQIANLGALACSMCMMRARVDAGGEICLAFRSAEQNIRDFYVLKGRATGNPFTAVRVNQDNWEIKSCPMCGPELTIGPDGKLLCAFMSRHRVYWSVADRGVSGFTLHQPTPAPEPDEIYPTAVANRAGDVLLVWQVGPMSTTGTATVKWALYQQDGQPTGKKGTIGTTTSGTKATAFVGTDDDFYILTTAK